MPDVVPELRPAAVIMNGEVTVDPFAGEQMFTPGEAGAVQLCACACVAPKMARTLTRMAGRTRGPMQYLGAEPASVRLRNRRGRTALRGAGRDSTLKQFPCSSGYPSTKV